MKDHLNIKIGDYCNYVNSSTKNFHAGNYSDSALNSRKAAEAACKLLIYHAFPTKVAENKIEGKTLRELIIVIIKDKVAERKAINHLETLQIIGNKSAHDNLITKDEAQHCINALNLLSDYIFTENLKIAKPSALNFELTPKENIEEITPTVIEKIVIQEKIIQQKIDKETEDALLEKLKQINQSEHEKYQIMLSESQKELREVKQNKTSEEEQNKNKKIRKRHLLITLCVSILLLSAAFVLYFRIFPKNSTEIAETLVPQVHLLDTSYVAINAINILQDNPNMQFNIEEYLLQTITRLSRISNVPIKITFTKFKKSAFFEKDSLLSQAAALGYDVVYFGELYESTLDSNLLEITGAFTGDRNYFRYKKIKYKSLNDSTFIKEINDQSNMSIMRYVTQQQEKRPYNELSKMLEPLICYSVENYASIKGFQAKMKMGAKDFTGALKIHNEILRILPNDKRAFFYKAASFTELGMFDSSQIYFNNLLSVDSLDTFFLTEYAYLKVKQNKLAEAKTILTKVLRIDKNNKTAAQWLANLSRNEFDNFLKYDITIKEKTATAFMASGNYSIALKYFNEIYLINPSFSTIYGRMAKCYIELHDKQNALKFGKAAVAADSSKLENTLLYASILTAISPSDSLNIVRYFDLSLKLDPKKIELYDNYCNYLISQKQFNKCIEVAQNGRKYFPNNFNIACFLGTSYMRQKEFIKAKTYFEVATRIMPDDYMLQTLLATCYLNTTPVNNADFYKGYASIQNAISVQPNNASTQLVYALFLLRLRQFPTAKKHYLKAKALDHKINDSSLEALLK